MRSRLVAKTWSRVGQNRRSLLTVAALAESWASPERLMSRVASAAPQSPWVALIRRFDSNRVVLHADNLSRPIRVAIHYESMTDQPTRIHLESLDFPSRHPCDSRFSPAPKCANLASISCSWCPSRRSTRVAFASAARALAMCTGHCLFGARVDCVPGRLKSRGDSTVAFGCASSRFRSIREECRWVVRASFVDDCGWWAAVKCSEATGLISEQLSPAGHPSAGESSIRTPKKGN